MNTRSLIITLFIISSLTINIVSKTKDEWKTRVIYQLLTDRFSRTDGSTGGCDLSKYCGGTFKGIQNNLDYIQDLGFNAIWISPVIENTEGGYHGYWLKNLYAFNPYFGTEQDFIDLVAECHKRDIWMMVDVVANHVGPVGTDYSQIVPFNKPEHYHDYCIIDGYDFINNQVKVEVKV
jgi:alpha-amylase